MNEADITKIIKSAGGVKLKTRDKESKKTADYLFNEAIIELKLIEEDGLTKKERQEKLVSLFKRNQEKRPTVIIDKNLLTEEETRKYYKILETPIKVALKSASKQLKSTQSDLYPEKLRICTILNIGYASLNIEEFAEIAYKKAKNDTTGIDFLIVGGVYFFGDGFDFYSLFPIELLRINSKKSFESFSVIKKQWGIWANEIMTDMVRGVNKERYEKTVNYDISFRKDNIYFVKPTPLMGKRSDYYINGRPRKNSTGLDVCPTVAKTFPLLDLKNWEIAKNSIEDEYKLEKSHSEYLALIESVEEAVKKPLVPIPINYYEFMKYCDNESKSKCFHELCYFANKIFSDKLRNILDNKKEIIENKTVMPVKYIFLYVEEIGQDCKFDISKLSIVHEGIYAQKEDLIFENENIFFMYASTLAAAYAIKNKIDFVYYEINRKYGWY